MNLRQIRLLVAIADEASVSRGAERELLTQSTASQHIASLEKELGVKLFDRTARGVALTQGGALLLVHARKILAGCEELTEEAARFAGMVGARVRIGCSTIPGNYLVPQVLGRLRRKAPVIRYLLTQAASSTILQQLLAGEVELAVVGREAVEKGLECEILCADRMLLAAPAGHPLAGRKTVEVEDLAGETLLMREAGSGSARAVIEALRDIGIDEQVTARWPVLASTEAIREAVLSGLGIAFLSSCAIERELARGELVQLRVKGLEIHRNLYLAWRGGRTLSPAAICFVEELRGFTRERPGGPTC